MEAQENAESPSQKKIVDIDNDCLERMFEYLDFCDLINVAEANVHLRVAAETVFVWKLKKRLIVVEIEEKLRKIAHPLIGIYDDACPDIGIYDDAISIRTSLLAVRTIRLFGQSITGIHLKIKTNDFLRENFFRHVNEYCHKTLNILQIFGDHSNMFGAVTHPFENVEKFSYDGGTLGPGCEHFNRLFPRLSQIKLVWNDILHWKWAAQTFSNLNSFTLQYKYMDFPTNFVGSDLITFTTLNPQIQSFELLAYGDPRIWEIINTQLNNMTRIHTSYSPKHAEHFNGAPILFNNVETFVVRWHPRFLFTVNPTNVYSFKRLKRLIVECWSDELEMWLDFVLAHPTIEELEIRFVNEIGSYMNWIRYEKLLKKICQKLNKVRQNTKFISLWVHGDPDESRSSITEFLKDQKWFDQFSIAFDFYQSDPGRNLSKFQKFTREMKIYNNLRVKNYKIKKTILMKYPQIDFEKCE